MTLSIRRERTTDCYVVRLLGDFESRMADAVSQAIVSTPERAVVLDLSDLNSLDEDGLRALLDAGEDLARAGKELTVVGARGDVMAAIRPFDRQSSTEDLATGPSLRVERRGVRQE